LSPEPSSPRFRRALALAVPVALAGSLVAAGSAFADAFTPESGGSPNANDIDTLYKLIAVLGLIVFIAVEGALWWAFFRYRARKGRVAAQIHGNTRLEIGWTVAAALILVFITAFTFIKLPSIKDPASTGPNGLAMADQPLYATTDQPPVPGDHSLHIKVDGQQYVWRFQYPSVGGKNVFAYYNMVVPLHTTVVLDITSDDVAHSWWIPKLGGKADAVPGYTNHTWFKALHLGVFRGQCAELCGRNHANMLAEVTVLTPQAYQKWYDRQASLIKTAQKLQAQERKQFETPTVPGSGAGQSRGVQTNTGTGG
jgi:cytochrome c oxidase subunit 2